MGFPRPAFQDLINSAQSDLMRLPGAVPQLRRSLVQILAYMNAALASGEYDYLDWMVQNVLLPDTATGVYLDRWANIVGLQREGPAQAAGMITITGNPDIPIPVGTQAQTSNSGVTVTTTASVTIAAGQTQVNAPAVATAGSAGNLVAGTPVNLLVGIAGILGNAIVASPGMTGGADSENDDALRVRVLAALSLPPQGGAAFDYVSWAKLVPGVTRVWVYGQQFGPGTVGVCFVMDGRSDIIPLSADITNVQNSINAYCPVTASPTAYAPNPSAIPINIHNLTVQPGYSEATVKTNISDALAALFATTTPGGYGWDGQAKVFQTGGALDLNLIYAAIDNAAGVNTFDLTAPAADLLSISGTIYELGPVTYV